MASAIIWPRCAFAWKSESLNKPPASVRASGDSSPRRRLSDEEEGVAKPCRTVRPIVALMKMLDFRGLGPRSRRSLDHHDHDYVAPRLLFVFPLCSCPVLGLGGLLLVILATLR
ncbi:hypothetical protein ALC53_06390 [Atta colombica]|uniref:Uncharacterized protein n=1 Tax=Atta colombica TaxID=520822 RepID=A0A195BFZ2_9HYME|nr:hypothetical protein ALC53_06390 [Atta colombica]